MVVWDRLIRFIATDGRTLRGEPILPSENFDLGSTTPETKLKAKVIIGNDIYDDTGKTVVSDEIVEVKQLLGPLAQQDIPILRCVGLNYAKHIKETGRTPPPFPFIFFKPVTTVTDHNSDVVIPKIAQDDQADYEGELCLILSRDAKDVPESEALSYIAAYTIGNDISSRKLQRDPAFAGRIPQWGFSKGFDTFAPLGPCLILSRDAKDVPESEALSYIAAYTIGNDISSRKLQRDPAFAGRIPQWGFSKGFDTFAPLGPVLVNSKLYLKPGDIMEVSISGIGTLRNGVKFA
ncbi:related to fumarylacetoacetate hydralase [Phialocephala subalpina]|uniref:Related to fumarylacetoacetate hydralase n=1 Tax=Phialocephala subalpina TaxID=576137 RepID=A0A1L7XPQ1_9HELO|nr:related to fumarylacetoacetate hydralase [Phialocephala subalpina]